MTIFKCLAVTSFLFMCANAQAGKLKVMIDPGHGGDDFGATHNGVVEKNISLAVSQELFKLLQKDKRFETQITRNKDEYLSLEQRSQKAEQAKVDVFLSIHGNSSNTVSARGTEIYFESQTPTDEESMLLANKENNVKNAKPEESNSDVSNILSDLGHSTHMTYSSVLAQNILESLQKEMHVKTRSIRQAPFHVISVSMPAALLELGFISNAQEAQWLSSKETQLQFARAIVKGLIHYKEKLDKIPSKP